MERGGSDVFGAVLYRSHNFSGPVTPIRVRFGQTIQRLLGESAHGIFYEGRFSRSV